MTAATFSPLPVINYAQHQPQFLDSRNCKVAFSWKILACHLTIFSAYQRDVLSLRAAVITSLGLTSILILGTYAWRLSKADELIHKIQNASKLHGVLQEAYTTLHSLEELLNKSEEPAFREALTKTATKTIDECFDKIYSACDTGMEQTKAFMKLHHRKWLSADKYLQLTSFDVLKTKVLDDINAITFAIHLKAEELIEKRVLPRETIKGWEQQLNRV